MTAHTLGAKGYDVITDFGGIPSVDFQEHRAGPVVYLSHALAGGRAGIPASRERPLSSNIFNNGQLNSPRLSLSRIQVALVEEIRNGRHTPGLRHGRFTVMYAVMHCRAGGANASVDTRSSNLSASSPLDRMDRAQSPFSEQPLFGQDSEDERERLLRQRLEPAFA